MFSKYIKLMSKLFYFSVRTVYFSGDKYLHQPHLIYNSAEAKCIIHKIRKYIKYIKFWFIHFNSNYVTFFEGTTHS